MQRKERNISLDITRIIAIIAVVMIHTSGRFVASYDISSSEFLWGNLLDSIARLGVPLFVMISGSLMLDEKRNIDIKTIFTKNIKNLFLLLVFWSGFYSIVYNVIFQVLEGQAVNLHQVVDAFLMGHYHMWYMYMIIGLYIITPFLREIVKKENKNLALSFVVISCILQFAYPLSNMLAQRWEVFLYIPKLLNKFHLDFFFGYTTYYIMGWYLTQFKVNKKWLFYCLGFISLITYFLYVQKTGRDNEGYLNTGIFVFLYSVSVFILLTSGLKYKVGDKFKAVAAKLSQLTFGVYMVHPLILKKFTGSFIYTGNAFLYILVVHFVVLVISFLVCYLISKIPVVKKIIKA